MFPEQDDTHKLNFRDVINAQIIPGENPLEEEAFDVIIPGHLIKNKDQPDMIFTDQRVRWAKACELFRLQIIYNLIAKHRFSVGDAYNRVHEMSERPVPKFHAEVQELANQAQLLIQRN